ncbi:MAG: ferritin family protein [Desulfonatronovibrionaceae bacterium]
MKNERMYNWVCKALEMEEKGYEFYNRAVKECPKGPAREVFAMLRDDEIRHRERIKELARALEENGDWESVCTLDSEFGDAHGIFSRIVAKHDQSSCKERPAVLDTGIEFELALVQLYEQALDQAAEDKEKEFLQRMIQEEKAHYILLSDLSYFYEDPQAWARDQDRGGLDGA